MTLPDEVVKGLFTLGGVIIGATIKWYADSRNKESRKLTVRKAKPVDLVVVAQQVASRIEVHVDGKKADVVATSELQIMSTGNRAVMKPLITFTLEGAAKIIAIEKTSIPQGMEEEIKITSDERKITVQAPHLNPLQEIGLRILTDGKEYTVKSTFSQPDVLFRERDTFDSAYLNPITAAFFETIRSSAITHVYFKLAFEPYRRYIEDSRK